jgi:hypothetical protein
MTRVIVHYRVKPDRFERNEELVRAVYEELHRADPPVPLRDHQLSPKVAADLR